MIADVLVAAAAAGIAGALALDGGPRAIPRRGGRPEPGRPDRWPAVDRMPEATGPTEATVRFARSASAAAGLSIWLLIGGTVGLSLGGAAAVLLPVALRRLETARARRERLALVRAAPLVADLLAASLIAGVPVERALPVVARAVGGPAGEALKAVSRRLALGAPPDVAWLSLDAPGLAGIARAVARSSRTGAPLATLLAATAVDLRAEASAAALVEVRAASVRTVLPLGLCLLPAFALLGIVPIVAGLLPGR